MKRDNALKFNMQPAFMRLTCPT